MFKNVKLKLECHSNPTVPATIKKVLGICANYYAPEFEKVVMHHLTTISLVNVDTESIFTSLQNYFWQCQISSDFSDGLL